jgi:hypothetical protein
MNVLHLPHSLDGKHANTQVVYFAQAGRQHVPDGSFGLCDEPNEYAGEEGIRTAFPRRLAGIVHCVCDSENVPLRPTQNNKSS